MKDRIKLIRKENGLTQLEFAEKLNLSQNFVSKLEIGQKIPSDRTIKDICDKFRINEAWLKDGIEPMYKTATRSEEISALMFRVMGAPDDDLMRTFFNDVAKLTDDEIRMLAQLIHKLTKES